MLAFLKHKFSRKDKVIAKWGAEHLAMALLVGVVLAGWLIMRQESKTAGRVVELQQDSAEVVATNGTIPPGTGNVGGPFALTDQDGKPVTDKNFAGKYLLVYFGYTSCPDMCPTGLQSMSRTMDELKSGGDKVQPIFITVDPARDTPQRLKEYDSSFHPKIVGLTGSPDQIAAVAKEYQVYYKKGEGGDDYTVDHSSVIYLMSPDGKLVTTFDEEANPHDIVSALEKAGAGG